MTVNGYLICNALIIIVPLLGVAIYNKAMKKKNKGISFIPVLLIISIVLMVLQYITKEILFGAFSCLVDLFMMFGIIFKVLKIIKNSCSVEERQGYLIGGIIAMLIPVVLTGISIFIL